MLLSKHNQCVVFLFFLYISLIIYYMFFDVYCFLVFNTFVRLCSVFDKVSHRVFS